MRGLWVLLVAMAWAVVCMAQPRVTRYTYYAYEYGSAGRDTTRLYVLTRDGVECHYGDTAQGRTIPGYAEEATLVTADSVYRQYAFHDGSLYYSVRPYGTGATAWITEETPDHVVRHTASINSNKIEIAMGFGQPAANPLPAYGKKSGTLLRALRNGQVTLELGRMEQVAVTSLSSREQGLLRAASAPATLGTRTDARTLARLKRDKTVLTWRIFDTTQLHWGAPTVRRDTMPRDTVIHFAGGTLALRRVTLPTLPSHYQWFAELHERSNGDAYDRTGSLFVVPQDARHTFFRGISQHPDSLPSLVARDGERYQGMVSLFGDSAALYLAPLEFVRFFTPFGVGHFNTRGPDEAAAWQQEAYYKQEITDVADHLRGDVWIGAYIGNYDRGGHTLTLDLKAYPQSAKWEDTLPSTWSQPLFNTCNVLEMAGQNYAKFFRTDSLRVRFWVPAGLRGARLRYLGTGHGGWDTGDEFVPREHHLIVDDSLLIRFTPWRGDCGTFRDKNPVSGVFWNGVASSDYSRSGWCPGTATQPAYFDLSALTPGWHTLTIAIPQGDPVEGGFSYWNVSGALVGHIDKTTR